MQGISGQNYASFILTNKRRSVREKLSFTIFNQQKLINFVELEKILQKYYSKKVANFG